MWQRLDTNRTQKDTKTHQATQASDSQEARWEQGFGQKSRCCLTPDLGLQPGGRRFKSDHLHPKPSNHVTLTYSGVNAGPHAVTKYGTDDYAYDDNGNMTSRDVPGDTQTLTWDDDHQLVSVADTSTTTSFLCDASRPTTKLWSAYAYWRQQSTID